MSRTSLTKSAEVACFAALALILVAIVGVAQTFDFDVERELFEVRWTGYTAIGFLLGSLAVSPAIGLLGRWADGRVVRLAAFRRALGLAAALAAVAHGLIVVSTPICGSLILFWYDPQFRGGLSTAVILLALAVTSYPKIVGALHIKLWKPLHRLVYLAGVLAVHHLSLSSHARPVIVVGLAALLAVLFALRAVPVLRARPS